MWYGVNGLIIGKEYHDDLFTNCVKRVSLILEKLMQVELKKVDRFMEKIVKTTRAGMH